MRRLAAMLFPILFLLPGCATFRYEGPRAASPHPAPRTALRIGVLRFTPPADTHYYLIRFGNTLADPIDDISRAVADALRRSGLVADTIYLDVPSLPPAELDYYREIYGLDAVLSGEVGRFHITSAPELWSLVPPIILIWPLHLFGVPSAPCHDSALLHGEIALTDLAPGGARWRSGELRFSWEEHNWYSSLSVPAIERGFQIRALDHFVASLVDALRSDPRFAPEPPGPGGAPAR